MADLKRRCEPPSPENWYGWAAKSLEDLCDALLRQKEGIAQRLVHAFAGKLGMTGAPAAIFATASLVGTASTGTAISSLSGAALNSATLAWIGGSVAAGSVIIVGATVVGAVGAALVSRWAFRRFLFGRKRKESELEETERRILDACLAMAVAFRRQQEASSSLDPASARALSTEALPPLLSALQEHDDFIGQNSDGWPVAARARLRAAVKRLRKVADYSRKVSSTRPVLTTGIVGAVITQLLAERLPQFDANEQIVLDAMRRANSTLADASVEDLAAYVKSLDPVQLRGLRNNVLGIAHELRFMERLNGNGDHYTVELFEATNHPGADVRITNTLTGEFRDVQLKASKYRAYVEEHSERYLDIPLMTTDELASSIDGVESSGISYEELSGDVETVTHTLGRSDDPAMWESMSMSGILWLARNVRVLMNGGVMRTEERRRMIEGGARTAVVAGLVHTIIA